MHSKRSKFQSLKTSLESLKTAYDNETILDSDPIVFPYRFKNPRDIEIVGFFASFFAYGNVRSIQSFLDCLIGPLGNSPSIEIESNGKRFKSLLADPPYYRFQTKQDIKIILKTVQNFLKSHATGTVLEKYFLDPESRFIPMEGIRRFQDHFTNKLLEMSDSKKLSYGLQFFIGKKESQSPKKRICLFLRWMVRDNYPDFGLYKKIKPNQIPYPADVHIQKISRVLGISNVKSFGIKDSIALTEFFKIISPDDPLEYDFHLTRVGIVERCKGKYVQEICSKCRLKDVCLVVPRGIEPRLQG
ncbi:MAG: TIGR02757 family protein [Leptospira sp.]|nr:TIGR02757 family protein [Leptospira sp.]